MKKYLLDTHTLLWFFEGDKKLPNTIKNIMTKQADEVLISVVTFWEIAIKLNIGKLESKYTLEELLKLSTLFWEIDYKIKPKNLIEYKKLILHHRDPFDRMLIAKAISENMIILTKDRHFDKYNVNSMW